MIKLHRGNLRTLLIILAVIFMSYKPELFNIGLCVFFCGLAVHFISKGFLNRNAELAVNGPYSFVRHPFYIANLLLDSGIICMSGHPVFIPVYLILYYISYHRVILGEEAELTAIYGNLYLNFMKAVPRYFPKLKPYKKDWKRGFKWENIMREREISRILRLMSYPISFLIIHAVIKYKMHQPNLILFVSAAGISFSLMYISYLFHNLIERDRILKNIKPWITDAVSFTLIICIGILLILHPVKHGPLSVYLTVFLCLLSAVLIFIGRYWAYFAGECAFFTALCAYSGLFWVVPLVPSVVLPIAFFNFKRVNNQKRTLFFLEIRFVLYIIIFVLLFVK